MIPGSSLTRGVWGGFSFFVMKARDLDLLYFFLEKGLIFMMIKSSYIDVANW